jgi:hypothetical protein
MRFSTFFSHQIKIDSPTVPVCGMNPSFVYRSRGGDRAGTAGSSARRDRRK